VSRFATRRASLDDAPVIAGVLGSCYGGREVFLPGGQAPTTESVATLLQTGNELLVTTVAGGAVSGVVRLWGDDGVEWFDMLASAAPGAGRYLVGEVECRAQDSGLRIVRTRLPGDERLPRVFQRWGYMPVSRDDASGQPALTVERRVPLLTVREQRRDDARPLAALTGEDPWPFEQGARPGWFVLADGERIGGAFAVRDGGRGMATCDVPVLMDAYRGRGIELWMIDVAVRYAETRGFHTLSLPSTPGTDRFARDLEDRKWHLEGRPGAGEYVRRLEEGEPSQD
jgi:GNAT superfamily N-acetyltransferase